MKSIHKIIIILLFAAAIAGCKKSFLDRPSNSQINSAKFYKTTSDLRLATASLYGGATWWQFSNEAWIQLGDILAGNGSFPYNGDLVQLFTRTVTSSNNLVTNGWVGLYNCIAQCNGVINAIQLYAPSSISVKDKNAAIAEARFIRAVAYYHLAIYFGDVPIIEDNSKLLKNPLLNRNIVSDVYKFVANDLTYAANNLPKTDDKGRVTTWSAQGMLGKVYLTMAGLGQSGGNRDQKLLDSAAKYAGNVCNNSNLKLFGQLDANHQGYYDYFRPVNNDNPESLFSLQWVGGVGYGQGNAIQLFFSPNSILTPQRGGAWEPLQPTYDLYLNYSHQDSIRRKATFMLTGDRYPELDQIDGGYYATDPGLKKHVIGTEKDNGFPSMDAWSDIEHNTILRLADVYLVYAEALLGNNSSIAGGDAIKYFNLVRTRAGVDPVTTLDATTLRKERRIELAYEGQYWPDLVRFSYYDPASAVQFVNSADVNHARISFTYDTLTKVAKRDTTAPPTALPATISSFRLPIPASEMVSDPKLLDPPVPYY
ncbi:MAG: RagB/SusD family nutrient uptake outer membrane protein [Bacteroidota bacterium]|nr:RagB/SusD family nutrient uptake outer membrane protein [Bacteroidota bacterium]